MRVRVVRVLVYEGPEEWVENVLKLSFIGEEGQDPRPERGSDRIAEKVLGADKSIKEVARGTEEIE